tara:strand:+ start:1358 stop:1828 length:471 start_codon:yes stop_codon:yes gene_type:complete
MKLCKTWCFVAIAFFVADIYMALTADKSNYKDAFVKTLDNDQKQKYEKIIRERRNIYFKGYAVGIVLSILFLIMTDKLKKTNLMSTGIICSVGGITLLTCYLFYIIHPKSDYMILSLSKAEQREKWLDIYRHMQLKYHMGLAFGVIAAMLMAKSTC